MSVNAEVLSRISNSWRDQIEGGIIAPHTTFGPSEAPPSFFTEDTNRRFSLVDPIVTQAMSSAVEDVGGLPHYRIEKQFVDSYTGPLGRPAVLYTARMFQRVPTAELTEKVMGDRNVSLVYTPGEKRWLVELPERLTISALPGVETASFRELSRSIVTYEQFMASVKKSIATLPASPAVMLEWNLKQDPEYLREAVFNLTRIAALRPMRRYNTFQQPLNEQ